MAVRLPSRQVSRRVSLTHDFFLVVLYGLGVALHVTGVDVHADDALGRLALSDNGIRRRELMVLDTFLAAGVPVAAVVGGG